MGFRISATIGAEIRDGRGRVIRVCGRRRARSLLCQFIQLLAVQMSNGALNLVDTGGVLRSVPANAYNFVVLGAAGATALGIVIGSGANAVTMTDYKLQAQITANVAYGADTVSVENPAPNIWRAVISRAFTNNTGAILQINEVGIYMEGSGTPYYFCMDRSLYKVSVPIGAAITLTYRLSAML